MDKILRASRSSEQPEPRQSLCDDPVHRQGDGSLRADRGYRSANRARVVGQRRSQTDTQDRSCENADREFPLHTERQHDHEAKDIADANEEDLPR